MVCPKCNLKVEIEGSLILCWNCGFSKSLDE